jgi:hypothetical protein
MQPVMFNALLEEGPRRTPEGCHRIKYGRFSACLLPAQAEYARGRFKIWLTAY